MGADGSDPINVSSSSANDVSPVWSPDGSRIAFVSDRDGNDEVYTVNADGTGALNLTNNPAADERPAWSATGTIAFATNRDGHFEIYAMNADRSAAVSLTNNALGGDFPMWSPSGAQLAIVRSAEIFVMNADGSGVVNVTQNTHTNGSTVRSGAAWSPNGSDIAFVTTTGFGGSPTGGIWLGHADGSAPSRIVSYASLLNGRAGTLNWGPTWSPDGSRIAFARSPLTCSAPTGCPRPASPGILVVARDGLGGVATLAGDRPIGNPVWKPSAEAPARQGRDGGRMAEREGGLQWSAPRSRCAAGCSRGRKPPSGRAPRRPRVPSLRLLATAMGDLQNTAATAGPSASLDPDGYSVRVDGGGGFPIAVNGGTVAPTGLNPGKHPLLAPVAGTRR